MRKCESTTETVKIMALACVVLHDICVELDDKGQKSWDLTKDPTSNKNRPRDVVKILLEMRCHTIYNTNPKGFYCERHLKKKFGRNVKVEKFTKHFET